MYFNKIEIQKAVINHLIKLNSKEIEPENSSYGICYELHNTLTHILHSYNICHNKGTDLVFEYSKEWDKFSGNELFPISSDDLDVTASEHFNASTNLWDDSPNGDDRRELCLYLANKLQDELTDYELELKELSESSEPRESKS